MIEVAGALQCPQCGATASPESTTCAFCQAPLALVACPHCFAKIFQGMAFCPYCGTSAARGAVGSAETLACPGCKNTLTSTTVGTSFLHECTQCGGVWMDTKDFEQLCVDQEKQTAFLTQRSEQTSQALDVTAPIHYVPCPYCRKIMNRTNFSKYSGVIIDICKAHGAWFDVNELRQVVKFIHDGGLDRSREKQIQELEEERHKLKAQTRELESEQYAVYSSVQYNGYAKMPNLLSILVDSLAKWLFGPK